MEFFRRAKPPERFRRTDSPEPFGSVKSWQSFEGEITLIGDVIAHKGKACSVAGAHAEVNKLFELNAPSYVVELVITTVGRKLILRGASGTYKQAIFVDQPADASLSSDAALTEIDRLG